jgi:hypothetical protein
MTSKAMRTGAFVREIGCRNKPNLSEVYTDYLPEDKYNLGKYLNMGSDASATARKNTLKVPASLC